MQTTEPYYETPNGSHWWWIAILIILFVVYLSRGCEAQGLTISWAKVYNNGELVAHTNYPNLKWKIYNRKRVCSSFEEFGYLSVPFSVEGTLIFKKLYDSICVRKKYLIEIKCNVSIYPEIKIKPLNLYHYTYFTIIKVERYMMLCSEDQKIVGLIESSLEYIESLKKESK